MPEVGIGFHTDAFNSTHKSFEECLQWAEANDVHYIEPGVIDGASWIHGLGYFPHVSMAEDPMMLREKAAKYGVQFSQIDAAYPLSDKDGPYIGVPYVLKAIPWAKHLGAPLIATTDGLYKPESLSDDEAMEAMKRSYSTIIEHAQLYDIIITLEVHGYFTTNPDRLEQMLAFCGDCKHLQLNLDTGNSFIAGNDPVTFADRFRKHIRHVHIKDVSASLAEATRGGATGIAISHCATGDGVNGDNIREVLKMLYADNFEGVLSIECEGAGGPMIEKSLAWLRSELADIGFTTR